MTKTYFHSLPDGRVQCDLCPHACKLKQGQQGRCFVRVCCEGKIQLSVYGQNTGLCVDPIEKKPLYHFLPGSRILSFGTVGCNLNCVFCQNWDLSHAKDFQRMSTYSSPEQIANMAQKQNCQSVAFTYNEPLVFFEYAIDTAKECHKKGLKTVAVTAGYINEKPCEEFFQYMDAANVDLKGFTESFYKKFCGAQLQPVLETLISIKQKTDTWLEVTTLLIPGENDSVAELHKLTEWIVANLGPDVPLHFSAFHPDGNLWNKPRTPLATLILARDIALKNGLRYVYLGNVSVEKEENTFCHSCKRPIIERQYFEVKNIFLSENKCPFCQTVCAGVF